LTSAVSLIFGSGIRSVLLPSFARLNHDRDRQEVAALSSIRIFLFIAIPTCGLAAVVAPGLVHVLWQGKWDGAGIVVLALLLSLPFGLALYIARSLLEARGGWGRAAAMSWSNGVLITLVTIWVGASNDLPWIAGVIASYRALSGLLFITVILMMCRISPLRLAPMIMPVICIGAGSILVSQWCSGGFFPEEQTLRHSIMAAGGFIGSFVVLSAVFVRTGYMEVISRLGRFRS
jgi:O-antigen/teichoic acid export membrane protein